MSHTICTHIVRRLFPHHGACKQTEKNIIHFTHTHNDHTWHCYNYAANLAFFRSSLFLCPFVDDNEMYGKWCMRVCFFLYYLVPFEIISFYLAGFSICELFWARYQRHITNFQFKSNASEQITSVELHLKI